MAACLLSHLGCLASSSLPSHHWHQPSSAKVKGPNTPDSMPMTSKPGHGDLLLDYMEGGPKLRKWYGVEDQLLKVSDSTREGNKEEVKEDPNKVRDAILVMDADTEIGQLIIVHLILKRVRIRALVRDAQPIMTAFGSYVEPVEGDAMDKKNFVKALKGVYAIICPVRVGALCDCGIMQGVKHVVFLSQLAVYRSHRGLNAFLNGRARQRAEEDEIAVSALGVPYTIIRSGLLQDQLGGIQGFNFQEGCASKGMINREDAAIICVEAIDVPPQRGLVFEVANGQEKVEDWKILLRSLQDSSILA